MTRRLRRRPRRPRRRVSTTTRRRRSPRRYASARRRPTWRRRCAEARSSPDHPSHRSAPNHPITAPSSQLRVVGAPRPGCERERASIRVRRIRGAELDDLEGARRASARARTETSLAPRFAEPSSAPTNANARPNRNRLLLRPGDRRTKTSRRLPARVDQSSTTRARRFSRRNVARDWRRRRRRVSAERGGCLEREREEARVREREEAREREREKARERERERRMERKRRSEAAEEARQSEEAAERVERESAARRAASDVGAMDLPDALRAVGFAPTDATDPVAVRKAYKRAALRFHPDRTRTASLADRVAGEEVRKLLGSKMEAYAAATRDGR